MSALVLVDGELSSTIPVDDRGFLFGDHVFETVLQCVDGAPLWPWHWQRLTAGCRALGIASPEQALLEGDLARVATNEPQVVRMTLTRGSSPGGYWLPQAPQTRRIVQPRPWPEAVEDQRQNGLTVATAEAVLPVAHASGVQALKHGNRLDQVMLAREAQHRGVDELLAYRADGSLAEGVASNVIVRVGDRLLSPATPEVSGVGLEWLRAQGVDIALEAVAQDTVVVASEVMLVNAIAGVRPVASLDGRVLASRDACRRLQSVWAEVLP